MKFGNRASLKSIPRKSEDVAFPELDTFYRIREMSGTERDRFEISAFKVTTNGSGEKREIDPLYLRARLVALSLVDEEGNRIYDDGQVRECSDELPASVLGKLFAAAQKLNGLDATAVEEAAKNSVSDLSSDSSTDLPSSSAKPSLNS
jgi:hypothetical protein